MLSKYIIVLSMFNVVVDLLINTATAYTAGNFLIAFFWGAGIISTTVFTLGFIFLEKVVPK